MSEGREGLQLLDTKEAAALLDVCERTIWRMISDGELQSVKIRRCRRIPRKEIERLQNGEGGGNNL